jgi:hypothetical protein
MEIGQLKADQQTRRARDHSDDSRRDGVRIARPAEIAPGQWMLYWREKQNDGRDKIINRET